jgi:trans-2-enoyl-CoA reductase
MKTLATLTEESFLRESSSQGKRPAPQTGIIKQHLKAIIREATNTNLTPTLRTFTAIIVEEAIQEEITTTAQEKTSADRTTSIDLIAQAQTIPDIMTTQGGIINREMSIAEMMR